MFRGASLAALIFSLIPGSLQAQASYHMEMSPRASRFKGTQIGMVANIHSGTIVRWVLVAAQPLSLPWQSGTAELQALGQSARAMADLTEHRNIVVADIRSDYGLPYRFQPTVTYQVVIHPRQLMRGPAPAGSVVPVLSTDEKARDLASDDLTDWKDPTFGSFLNKWDLRRHRGEGDVEFAWRVYQAVDPIHFTSESGQVYKASAVAQRGQGNCVAIAILYAAILRASGIPTYCEAGRFLKSTTGNENPSHVRNEFWASGVGWVPVDVPSHVFGVDKGDFLSLFLCGPPFKIDENVSVNALQDIAVQVGGNGDIQLQLSWDWQVASQ